jgi:hypothetical protein
MLKINFEGIIQSQSCCRYTIPQNPTVVVKGITMPKKNLKDRKSRSDKFSLTLHPTGQFCKKIKGKIIISVQTRNRH